MKRTWALAAVVPALVAFIGSAAAQHQKRILILYSDSRINPAIAAFDETFRKILAARSKQPLEIFTEFLDFNRFDERKYQDSAARYLREKYETEQIDVVVAGRFGALKFLLRNRSDLFPGVPVVHAGVEPAALAGLQLPKNVNGAPFVFDVIATAEVALRLHSKARKVVIITGAGAEDILWRTELNRQLPSIAARATVDQWSGLGMSEILARLAALSPETIVLTPGTFKDADGRSFTPAESIAQMSKVSGAPIYGLTSTLMGSGLVGGSMILPESVGQQAAEIVLRVLSGEVLTPSALPPLEKVLLFDGRQLRRWGIRDADLPPGSKVLYREPTFWAQYFWYGVAAIVIVLLQAGLIGGLLVERRTRRNAEISLRESDVRIKLAAKAAKLGMWRWDVDTDSIWTSARNYSIFGLGHETPTTMNGFMKHVHPDDRDVTNKAISAALSGSGGLDHELRIVDRTGKARWAAMRGRVEFTTSGKPKAMLGVAIDISNRKEAEREAQQQRNELAHLSRVGVLGQLSGALAHELAQPLTAILSNAQAAQRFLANDTVNLDELREILTDIVADDIRAGEVIRRLRALLKRGETRMQAIDVNDVVHDVRGLVNGDLVTRNISFDYELSAGLPLVKADRIQLQQVLLNIIVNACDAMAGNEAGDRTAKVVTENANTAGVKITISDRGPGIEPMMLDNIFEPFVSNKSSGLGLGLSISRSIIQAHGGHLWATNNPDRGAAFHITVPIHAETAP